MIKEVGRLERIGRPIIYGTTDEFLRAFSLETLDEMPDLNEMIERIDLELDDEE